VRVDRRARAIRKQIQAIEAIGDPTERAKAATDALDVIKDGNRALSATRRDAVIRLREQGLSLRVITGLLGLRYHRTVQQIINGEPTGTGTPGRKKAPDAEAPEAGQD
jgi:hypothetical protein